MTDRDAIILNIDGIPVAIIDTDLKSRVSVYYCFTLVIGNNGEKIGFNECRGTISRAKKYLNDGLLIGHLAFRCAPAFFHEVGGDYE